MRSLHAYMADLEAFSLFACISAVMVLSDRP
jgi:hypothetical protein